MDALQKYKQWIKDNKKRVLDDFFSFLKFRSISTDPAYQSEMEKCSSWLTEYIQKNTNLQVEKIQTSGAPIVYAENLDAGKNAPTILIYGHYDVQPVDPIEEWNSDPFDPQVKENTVFARGASDDKGQIFYAITAIRACKELNISFGVNIKLCIEGEEESASGALKKAMNSLEKKFKTDALLVIDFDQFDPTTPAVSLGARGLAAFEITINGSKGDLHSGMHGGMAYNPNRALVELLAKVWDDEGYIQISSFYDDVEKRSEEMRKEFSFPYDEKSYSDAFGIKAFGGESKYSLGDRNRFRPTFEINGISGGYTGEGFKTVIPHKAVAKISCRLVPNQDPEKVRRGVEEFFKSHIKEGMDLRVTYLGGEKAFLTDPSIFLAKAVEQASTEVMGKECKKAVSGGSIPIIAQMSETLKAPAVGMGYGLSTDNIHAPNEHFGLDRFEKGFLTVARTLELI